MMTAINCMFIQKVKKAEEAENAKTIFFAGFKQKIDA
jgi:hypothetical protein